MNALTAMQLLPDVQAQQDFRRQRIDTIDVEDVRIGSMRAVARRALSGVSS